MKISEKWLREWVDPPVSTEELAEQLTMAGLEVDSIEAAAPAFEGIMVGNVLSVEPHPDADKLRICRVDVGQGDALTIVCGAPNVYEGMRAPTAVVGARLPGDFKIKRAKLRGVESFGMLCSAKELGLAESSDGLMELPGDAPIGTDVRAYLELDDHIIDVDLTPNRGDCLSMAGVAREAGVLNRCPVSGPAVTAVSAAIEETLPITVTAPEACPRYLGRIIRGVDPTAVTPLWMRERLRRGGIRSLGPLVDVTNYVLLELGQPMHAFDLACLQGGVEVRWARAGETVTLLDGKELAVDPETLVIADSTKAVALAGIMGGLHSGVSAETRDVFLECAFFRPTAVAGRARRYGMQTDSSYRFERGVDPQLQERAMERATQLLLDIVGGTPGPVSSVASEAHLPAHVPVALRSSRLLRLLGLELASNEVADILVRLGMEVTETAEGWEVLPPPFRFDVAIEADLIEEVGRIHGYHRIPSRAPGGHLAMHPVSEGRLDLERLCSCLVDRGFQEVVTYSFVDPADQALLEPEQSPIALANPISSELAVMRTSLWPGLLRALLHNVNRQQERVRIFEYGLKFTKQDNEIKQINMLSGAVTGAAVAEQWGEPARAMDFFDLKGDIEALLDLTGRADDFIFKPARHPALHPGQTARLERNNRAIGWLGALHPAVQQQLGVSDSILVFEVELAPLREAAVPRFQALSKYPSIRRDLAIVVDESVSSDQVQACVRRALPDVLREIRLFDVYRGKGIDSGRKSLALGLILQESSRTLTDEDVDAAISRVVAELKQELGAALRD